MRIEEYFTSVHRWLYTVMILVTFYIKVMILGTFYIKVMFKMNLSLSKNVRKALENLKKKCSLQVHVLYS